MLPRGRVHPYFQPGGILRSILALLRTLSTDDLFTLLHELLTVRFRFHLVETQHQRLPPPSDSDSQ